MANDTNDTSTGVAAPAVLPAAPTASAPAAAPVPAPATVAPVAPVTVADTAFPITAQEFCTRLSASDKRVELISAFHYTETAAGTVKDTEAAFTVRFAAFLNKPV